jgi:hypothetical protein
VEDRLDLASLQQRLSQQYARLRDLRATENYPVYAIEHNLTAEECSAAQVLLNESFRANMRVEEAHWLVWIAAAAEVGYRYDGAEYWDTFGAAFPNWSKFGDRNRSRDQTRIWYKQFAQEYRGLTPSGPWAKQFPIIAWPITQAILPRYLQRQFAEHLYGLRFILTRSGEYTLDEIGELLNSKYYGGSSRFEGFLQQKTLTARIVLALGLEGVEDAITPIEKVTLDRIVNDIDKLGSFGRLLREARKVLREARFINSAKPGFVPKTKPSLEAPTEMAERPRLMARTVDDETWSLSLVLPDLASALRQEGLSPRDLDQTRMRYRSHEGSSWSPARGLFFYNGEHEVPLATYPKDDIYVFEFEQPLAAAQTALLERLRFAAQSLRLLKLRADGVAFEVVSRYVRANQNYILAASVPIDATAALELGLAPQRSNSRSAYLWRFDVPSSIDTAGIAALHALGLGYKLGVRVEPLGLSPRWATSNGALVLLDTEAAMFNLSSEVSVREYLVGIDGQLVMRIAPATGGSTFISIGALSVGVHRVSVAALGAASGGDIVSENMVLEVRSAFPWRQAIEGKAGVMLSLDPREAPIEQLLGKTAFIRMTAPPRRKVTLKCRLFGADGMLFRDEIVGRQHTPVSDEKLSELVVQHLTADAQLDHLERAARIEVQVNLDEYGSGHVAFEKDSEPLRWLRVNDKKIRLSDDSADASPPTIERFDLDAVDIAATVDYEQALSAIELHGKGGLFVATLNGRRYKVIATAIQHHLTNFNQLGVPARLSATPKQPSLLVSALTRWHGVRRMIGPMAYVARSNAIDALERSLEASLCGDDWIVAVDRVISGTQQLGELYGRVYYSRGFASGIAKFAWAYEADKVAAESEFLRLLEVYKIPADLTLASLALRVAFQPHTLDQIPGHSPDVFDALRSATALIRGAFFARLALNMTLHSAANGSAE